MIFYVDKIRQYEKVIKGIMAKCEKLDNTFFLDFSKGVLEISDPESGIFATLSFQEGQSTNGSDYSGYVDALSFLAISKSFDDLEVTEDLEFFRGEESFKLKSLDRMPTNFDIDSIEVEKVIDIDHEIAHMLEASISHLPEKPKDSDEANKSAMYFQYKEDQGSKLITTDGTTIFIGDVSDYVNNSFLIPGKTASVCLAALSEGMSVSIFDETEHMGSKNRIITEFEGGEMKVVFSKDDNLSNPPDFFDKNILKRLTSEDYLLVEKYVLVDILKFFSPFTSRLITQDLELSVESDNEAFIKSNVGIVGKRVLDINSVSPELIGTSINFPRDALLNSLKKIHDDFIQIAYSEESAGFSITGSTNKDIMIGVLKIGLS